MEFCSKCGGLLRPTKVDGKTKLYCKRCKIYYDLPKKKMIEKDTSVKEKGEFAVVEDTGGRKNFDEFADELEERAREALEYLEFE